MFKTINECNLELVSYTVSNVPTKEITLLQDDANQAKSTSLSQKVIWTSCLVLLLVCPLATKTALDKM